MGNTSKYEMAYFAGFFDGEGCISIASQGSKYKGETSKHYRLEVTVGNTNHWSVEQIRFQFGGGVYLNRPGDNLNHRPFWRWIICGNQAKLFLINIMPYLKLKKPEAELAIRWQENRHNGFLPLEEREKRGLVAEAQRIMLSQMKREVRQ